MKHLKLFTVKEGSPDFIDFSLRTIGSYNVLFKHAKWAWWFHSISFRFVYPLLAWISLVYFLYGYVAPQALWGIFFMIPLMLSVLILFGAGDKIVEKHYPRHRNRKNWGLALNAIDEENISNELKRLKLLNSSGIQKVSDIVYREESSDSSISTFQLVFVGGFIPLSAAFLGWLFEHKVSGVLAGIDLSLRFMFLLSTIGFVAFAEEYMAKNNARSKRAILQRTRRVLDRLSLRATQ